MTKFTITSSEYGSLHFVTKEEYEAFKKDELQLWIKHFIILTKKHGYFAGNQDKYVPSLDDFGPFDRIPPLLKEINK